MAEDKRAKRLETFRTVADERIVRMNLAWIQFEQGDDEEARREFLREIHTLKGEASLMGFAGASDVAHAVEDALGIAAAPGMPIDPDLGDQVLAGLDLMGDLIAAEPGDGGASARDFADAIHSLAAALAPAGAETPAVVAAKPTAPAAAAEPRPAPQPPAPFAPPAAEPDKNGAPPRATEAIRVTSEKLDRMRDAVGELLLTRIRLSTALQELRKARDRTVEYREGLDADNLQALELCAAVGELLSGLEVRLREDDAKLDRLVSELEGTSRALRMVPISTLFEKYPRAVRSLARELGKKVSLKLGGQAVEVDRAVLDRLEEPLVHLVRNAVDHGIELPQQRKDAGKSETGTLSLSARVVGQSLHVSVSDDGGGIDAERVRRKAVALGIVEEAEVSRLSDEQVFSFLFAAGMSTRDTATSVSGRGIGLDVAMSNVEVIGGSIRVTSEPGQGTTFLLAVPITVAISSVLLLRVGSGRYCLPAVSVVRIVDAADYPIIDSVDGECIRFEERLIPLMRMDEFLGEAGGEEAAERAARLVVAQSAGSRVALVGSYDHTEREAVMKGVGALLERDPLTRAVVPLEDGSLALVLKASELVAAAHGGRALSRRRVGERAQMVAPTVLVVDDSPVIRDLVAEALRAHGVKVVEAADGEEALLQLDSNPHVALVVTDIEMPRLDGIGLIGRIRERPGPRLPTVVVSMRGSDLDKARAMEAGADAYLVKTDFSHKGLWAMVARFLE